MCVNSNISYLFVELVCNNDLFIMNDEAVIHLPANDVSTQIAQACEKI